MREEEITVGGAVNTPGSGLNQPSGVAMDTAGNVYVTDNFNNAVKEIAAASGVAVGAKPRDPLRGDL